MKKGIILFLGVFLFIQICEIYIMGGFDKQTTESKSIGIVLGCLFGGAIFAIILKEEEENGK